MTKLIKQWLVVYADIFYTDENARRYYDLFRLGLRHDGLSFSCSGIKNNGKILYIATLVAKDSETHFTEFCEMADKVNGMYCVSDIVNNANKLFIEMSNQE